MFVEDRPPPFLACGDSLVGAKLHRKLSWTGLVRTGREKVTVLSACLLLRTLVVVVSIVGIDSGGWAVFKGSRVEVKKAALRLQ